MLVIHFSLSPSQFGLHSASMQQTKSYILSSASHVGLTFCGKAQTDVSIDLGHTVAYRIVEVIIYYEPKPKDIQCEKPTFL